jgi:hypothetical protein
MSAPDWTPAPSTNVGDALVSVVAWALAPTPSRTKSIDPDTREVLSLVAELDIRTARAELLALLIAAEPPIEDAFARQIISAHGFPPPHWWDLPGLAAQALTEAADARRQLLLVDVATGSTGTRRAAIARLAQLEEVAA